MRNVIEEILTVDQAGFCPGKLCSGKLLNLTQHIENAYQRKLITGVTFVDLTAAYDTIQHRLMIKVYDVTRDASLCRTIQSLLENRRSHMVLGNNKSRWFRQNNELPQGSVLAPSLFNMHSNDQPKPVGCEWFIYADDFASPFNAP